MTADLDLIRAHLECAKQGYPVHVGCLGECTPSSPAAGSYWCEKCQKKIAFGSVAEPPIEINHYQRDVTWLLEAVSDLWSEREEYRRENKQACVSLADGFVPASDRAGAHLQGLPRLVAHAVEHHEWHHDAADSSYVAQVESQREEMCDALRQLHDACDRLMGDTDLDDDSFEMRAMQRAARVLGEPGPSTSEFCRAFRACDEHKRPGDVPLAGDWDKPDFGDAHNELKRRP